MSRPAEEPARAGADGTLERMFERLRDLGIRRNTGEKWLAGVCSGLATRLGVDPVLVRGALLLLVIFGGTGLLLYLIAWALLPDRDGRILAEEGVHGDGWGIALLVVIGLALVGDLASRWWLWSVLLPTGLLAWAVASRGPQRGSGTPSSPYAGSSAPPSAAGSTASPRVAGSTAGPAPTGTGPTGPAPTGPAPTGPGPTGPGPTGPGPAPHGMGPGRTGPVAVPVPRTVQHRRPRAGMLVLLVTVGLAVAAYGAGTQLATSRGWTATPHVLGLAFALGVLGVSLVLAGLRGRRAGFTTFLATLLALAAVGGTVIPDVPPGGFGDRVWSAASQPANGFQLTAGKVRLGLAGAAADSTVRVSMGAGDLTIAVPRDVTATIVPTIRAGQVDLVRAGQRRQIWEGAGEAAPGPVVAGTGPTKVTVPIALGVGQLTILEEP